METAMKAAHDFDSHPRPKTPRGSFDMYLEEIKRYPLLDREEEVRLARRARGGDRAALDRLVRANLRFVVSTAKRYVGQGVPLEDLVNEGNVGLVRAAHKFDPERGFKFISYAVWWVRQAILQSLANHSRIVRLPTNRAGTVVRVARAARELEQLLGRRPTAGDIAGHLGIAEEDVEDAFAIDTTTVSLDGTFSEDPEERTFVEALEDENAVSPDAEVYEKGLTRDIGHAVQELPERERKILQWYFGLAGDEPLTLEQIGHELGYTRERIRQLKEQAIERLRRNARTQAWMGYMKN